MKYDKYNEKVVIMIVQLNNKVIIIKHFLI